MSCDVNDEKVKITQGADAEFTVFITVEETKEPLDLTGILAAEARFRKSDDTALVKTLGSGVTVVSAVGGKIKVTLAPADTALLKPGLGEDFVLKITDSASKIATLQFPTALIITEQLI